MEGLIYLSKVMINYSLNNKEKVVKGIKNNNVLNFQDKDYKFYIKISNNEIFLSRENAEVLVEMKFNTKSSCKYFLKQYNKCVTFDIELIKMNINDSDIELIYKIEEEKFEFKVHYEVI